MKYFFKLQLLALFLIGIQGCSSHANYPVTRLADWIPKNHFEWEVLELSAKLKQEGFKWDRSKGHVEIRATIKISENENSSYKIKKLHIVQRYIEEEDIEKIASIKVRGSKQSISKNLKNLERYIKSQKRSTIPFALIEITPIIYRSNENSTSKKSLVFNLLINEPIQNRNYGRSYYRVKIGSKEVNLGTFIGK